MNYLTGNLVCIGDTVAFPHDNGRSGREILVSGPVAWDFILPVDQPVRIVRFGEPRGRLSQLDYSGPGLALREAP